MTLKSYLALIIIATITIIVIAIGLVFGYTLQKNYLDGIAQRGIELAKVIAHDEKVIHAVEASNAGKIISLQDYIEPMRADTDASFIVVVNKNAIRLSHPIAERVGNTFIGQDIRHTLDRGIDYTSVATGSLGKAIRNFAPIMIDGEIIGAVSIGYLSQTTADLLVEHLLEAGILVIFVYLAGVFIAIVLIIKLKKTFLNLEPEEIVQKFKEQELLLDSIRDGILAIDDQQTIITINRAAIEWLDHGSSSRQQIQGKHLNTLSQSLANLVDQAQGQLSKQIFKLGSLNCHVQLYPMRLKKDAVGYVIVFYPHYEENTLVQEFVASKNYANLLRSKTHEYSNRLNVLSGLLQSGKYHEAIDYLQQESDAYQNTLKKVIKGIDNSNVAGLILAKQNKANELAIQFHIDDDTQLGPYSQQTSENLVTLLGNLIDNALFAAAANSDNTPPVVSIYISDRSAHIMIEVEDSGAGIDQELESRILDFGISSKHNSEEHGIGLYLVKKIVDQYKGSLEWERSDNKTTVFSVYLDKQVIA